MNIENIKIFFSGFESIPYDLVKWGSGLIWKQLKEKDCLTPVGESLYDLIEKTIKERTGNQLSLNKISPACEMILHAYMEDNKVSIDTIKGALSRLGKNYIHEDAEIWKQDLDEQVSRTDVLYRYMLKREADSHGETMLGIEKK